MATKEQSAALAEHWRHHIDAWKASGQSQSSFCKANALNYHRFCYWQRKFQQSHQAARGGFAAVSRSPEPASCGLSITLPGGLVVQGITAGNLPLVSQLLNDLS